MTDPGLTNRLRQHSRRSGFMVGMTMALTIALCIVGFIWVFTGLEPYVSDFVHRDPPSTRDQDPPRATVIAQSPQETAEPTDDEQDSAQPPPERPEPTNTPRPQPTPTPNTFTPDYQITSEGSINLRGGPGVENAAITTVSLNTPLQFLGERKESQNPEADGLNVGQQWLKFRTEDGLEGWIREIDVEPYSP